MSLNYYYYCYYPLPRRQFLCCDLTIDLVIFIVSESIDAEIAGLLLLCDSASDACCWYACRYTHVTISYLVLCHAAVFFVTEITLLFTLIVIIISGQSNLTKGHMTAAHGQFSRICQVSPICTRNYYVVFRTHKCVLQIVSHSVQRGWKCQCVSSFKVAEDRWNRWWDMAI